MFSNNRGDHKYRWDDLVLVVYSVLVGLSLDKGFDFFTASTEKLSSAVLLVGIMIVVLENWIYLPLYFQVIDIDSKAEVAMYIAAAIAYSCIPGLYIARTQQTIFSAPEWIMLNFAAICLIDALTKTFTLAKLKRIYHDATMSDAQKDLAGTYVFYALTGFFYAVLLGAAAIGLSASHLDILVKSLIVTGSWLAVRTIDRLVVPRTASTLAHIYLGKL